MQMIDELCTECSLLIENHEKIQVLSSVHYNLGKTLQVWLSATLNTSWCCLFCLFPKVACTTLMLTQDVENIVALPHEAAEAEDMLKDDSQLLQVLLYT